jgi:beta-fructofuranosidase
MLLFFSHKRAGQYYVGTYDKSSHRLIPELHGRMNYGPISVGSLHAPSATIDPKGRYLGLFNVKEGKPPRGWEDIMTLPRVYSLGSDNSLRVVPVPEIESVRGDTLTVGATEIPANSEIPLEPISGRALELEAVIEPGAAREVGLYVLRSPDGAERTRVSLFRRLEGQRYGGALQIDVSEASMGGEVYSRTPETGPFDLAEGEKLRLRIFVDRSIVEAFAEDRQSLTVRAYPDRWDSSGVSLFARGGKARLLSLKAWRMSSIWPELGED